MTRPQELRNSKPGNRATAIPIIEEHLAKEVLPHTLPHHGFRLCGANRLQALLETLLGKGRGLGKEDADAAECVVELGWGAAAHGGCGILGERDVGPGHCLELCGCSVRPEGKECASLQRNDPNPPIESTHAEVGP